VGNPEQPSRQLQCPCGECGPSRRGAAGPPSLLSAEPLSFCCFSLLRCLRASSSQIGFLGVEVTSLPCPLPPPPPLEADTFAPSSRCNHRCALCRLPPNHGGFHCQRENLGLARPWLADLRVDCWAVPLFVRGRGSEPKAAGLLLQRASEQAGRWLFAVSCLRRHFVTVIA